MSLNLYHSHFHSSPSDPHSKVSSSQGTDASQPLVFGKQLSLISCISSLSIEDCHNSSDNEVFVRFLHASEESSKRSSFEKMKNHFYELLQSSPEKVQSFLNLGQGKQDENWRVMQHFIFSWLLFMGYGSNKNKKYFIGLIRLIAGEQKAHRYAKVYNNLNLLNINLNAFQQLLLNTCKNGWEYFIRQISKMEPSFLVRA